MLQVLVYILYRSGFTDYQSGVFLLEIIVKIIVIDMEAVRIGYSNMITPVDAKAFTIDKSF